MSTSDSAGASAAFDAYYELLGIPPAEQPPTYYRLLGLSPFESNGKVIERATDRQMSHLRSFKSGDAALASQQLLNEIAKASRVLLTPEEKEAYDRSLPRPAGMPPAPMPTMPLARPPMFMGPMAGSPQLLPAQSTTHLVQPIVVQVPSIPIGRAIPSQMLPAANSLMEGNSETAWSVNSQWLILVAGAIGCTMVLLIVVAAKMFGSTEEPVARQQDKVAAATSAGSESDAASLPPKGVSSPATTAVPPPTNRAPSAGKASTAASDDSSKSPVASAATSQAATDKNADVSSSKAEDRQPEQEPTVEPVPVAAPVGEWVDLFPLLKPKEDIVTGTWKFDGKELSASGNGMSKIRLPADLGDTSYDLQVEFISDTDPNNINVILPVGDRSVLLVGDGYLDVGTVSYFSVVRGKEPIYIPGHIRGQMLKPSVKYKYDTSVRLLGERAQLSFALNDKDTFSYNGPIDDLRIVPVYRLADDGWPGLSTWFCPVAFLSCKLRLHEGPGKITRAAPDAQK